jgi:hypothetical protein
MMRPTLQYLECAPAATTLHMPMCPRHRAHHRDHNRHDLRLKVAKSMAITQ